MQGVAFGAAAIASAMALQPHVPPWAEMWLVAGSLFIVFKWLTWSGRSAEFAPTSKRTMLGYLFGWVGLDVNEFCAPPRSLARPRAAEWALAVGKTLLGAAVLWGLVPRLPADRPVVAGGVGFAGLILFLHFGLFHLLALAWRQNGYAVRPIMQFPLLATSVADFWGQRWNRAYRAVSHDYFFRPAVMRFGAVAGTLVAFFASGLFHELVISFPAQAGFGGPTAYFVIQGVGLLFERSPTIRALVQRRPFFGWLYTLVFVFGPVGLLFHTPFLTHVIVPFLKVIRCLN